MADGEKHGTLKQEAEDKNMGDVKKLEDSLKTRPMAVAVCRFCEFAVFPYKPN